MPPDRHLTTPRLHLGPLQPDDAPALFPVFSDREAMRYWDHARHPSVDRTRALIQQMNRDDACWWAIRRDPAGPAIGLVGFIANTAVPGLGYILHPDHWRQGIMTEALRAAVDYGFTHRDIDRAELWIFAANIASQKLAEKVGFRRRGSFITHYPHLAEPNEMIVYGLYRAEWAGEPAPEPPAYTVQPVLGVPDVLAAAHYYRNTLGFHIEYLYGDPPTHAGLALADWTATGARLQLTRSPVPGPPASDDTTSPAGTSADALASQAATSAATTPPNATVSNEVALYFFVGTNIDALYERCRAAGVTIDRPLTSHPWGRREFTIRDPNGYRLRFGAPA